MPREKVLMTVAKRRGLVRDLVTYLRRLGATDVSEEESHYPLKLDTPAGLLRIHVDEDVEGPDGIIVSVLCKFQDVKRASALIPRPAGVGASDRLNRHSGKWNFHWDARYINDVGVYLDFTDAVDTMLALTPPADAASDDSAVPAAFAPGDMFVSPSGDTMRVLLRPRRIYGEAWDGAWHSNPGHLSPDVGWQFDHCSYGDVKPQELLKAGWRRLPADDPEFIDVVARLIEADRIAYDLD